VTFDQHHGRTADQTGVCAAPMNVRKHPWIGTVPTLHQLVMAAEFDHLTVLEDDDLVPVANVGQTEVGYGLPTFDRGEAGAQSQA
jgi:hypothetical protein